MQYPETVRWHSNKYLHRGSRNYPKPWIHLQIAGTRRVTWSTFYTEDSKFWSDLCLTSVWSCLLFPCEQVRIFCALHVDYPLNITFQRVIFIFLGDQVFRHCVPLSFIFRPQVIKAAFSRLRYPLLLVIWSISNFLSNFRICPAQGLRPVTFLKKWV